jgi:tetratricopeptide (TPR) repeat protein
MLDCQLFALDAGRHHLTNLLLHIANTLLLFAVFKQMTGALWRSAFVAAAFALHPLHVESVAWISERKDLLSSLFWILTMGAYAHYVKHPKASWYLATLLLFALGLMAKPMLVTLPLVLLLLDYWPLDRLQKNKNVLYRLIVEKVPFFVLSAISGIVTFLVQRTIGAVADINSFALRLRIANAAVSYLKYIGKMFWPAKLTILYPHPRQDLSMKMAALAALLLLVISVLAILLAPKRKYLLTGWLWYIATLVPVIGIIQVGEQAMADRYSYMTLTGLFIIIAWGLTDLSAKWKYQKTVLSISAMTAIAAMATCSWLQAGHWKDSFTVCSHALKVTTKNYKMHNNLANALKTQGKLDQAVSHYKHAINIDPAYATAYYNLGLIFKQQGKFDEAVDYYRQAIKNNPSHADAYNNLAIVLQQQEKLNEAHEYYLKALRIKPDSETILYNFAGSLQSQGKLNDSLEYYQKALLYKSDFTEALHCIADILHSQGNSSDAISYYRRALRIKPDSPQLHNNLANALKSLGKLNEAAEHYHKALDLKPDAPVTHYNMATLLQEQGRLDRAVKYYKHALTLKPKYPQAHGNLAMTLQLQGRFKEALSHYQRALQLEPNSPTTHNNLANILATHPDPQMNDPHTALEHALRAAELTNHKNPEILSTLAACYEKTGRFLQAANTAQKALEIATEQKKLQLADQIRKKLLSYQQKKP